MVRSRSLGDLALTSLRAERSRCRQELELARLRSRQEGGPSPDDIAALRAQAEDLTDELIRRYAADLTLVDSLLEPAYPRGKGSGRAPSKGGAAR